MQKQLEWNPEGDLKFCPSTNGYFLANLTRRLDRDKAFEGCPYFYFCRQSGLFMKP